MARSLAAKGMQNSLKGHTFISFFDQSKHLIEISFQTFIKDSLSGKY